MTDRTNCIAGLGHERARGNEPRNKNITIQRTTHETHKKNGNEASRTVPAYSETN